MSIKKMNKENGMDNDFSPLGVPEGHASIARIKDDGAEPANCFSFAEYQSLSETTATYPGRGEFVGLAYLTTGLASEAGEVAGKIAKGLRDANGIFDSDRRAEIEKEIGDNLWFLAELCTHFGISLENAALGNVAKLQDRMSRGVLGGSGDNR